MAGSESTTKNHALITNGKLELLLKVVFWVVPFIFAAGVWYSSSTATSAAVSKNEKSIERLSDDWMSHTRAVAHPVTKTKLDVIEQDVMEIKVEQKAIRAEQTRSSINLSAICQATGADCR